MASRCESREKPKSCRVRRPKLQVLGGTSADRCTLVEDAVAGGSVGRILGGMSRLDRPLAGWCCKCAHSILLRGPGFP